MKVSTASSSLLPSRPVQKPRPEGRERTNEGVQGQVVPVWVRLLAGPAAGGVLDQVRWDVGVVHLGFHGAESTAPLRRSRTMTTAATPTDWDIIVACLSPTKATVTIPSGVDRHARFLCDGMGPLSQENLDPNDSYLLYDWSHVRDSSVEALAECAAYLRRYVRGSDRLQMWNVPTCASQTETETFDQ